MKHQNINVIENGIKITLNLGRQGEYNVRDIKFDMSDFQQKYGDGTATIIHYPANGSAYTVPSISGDTKDSAVLDSNNILTWTIGRLATRYDGDGIAEITWLMANGLKKSIRYNTYCKESIGDYGADRTAQQSYIDQMIELASTITDLSSEFSDAERIAAEIVDARENAVSDIETLESNVIGNINTAKSESIEDIGDSKESALNALNTAKQTALTDIESAKQNAETDINAEILIAEAHANNASQSATNAQQSATSAQASADSASQSATQASASASNANQSAASASQSADNASSSANSASQSATSAQTSATNASTSEQNARQSAEDAQQSAEDAASILSNVYTKSEIDSTINEINGSLGDLQGQIDYWTTKNGYSVNPVASASGGDTGLGIGTYSTTPIYLVSFTPVLNEGERIGWRYVSVESEFTKGATYNVIKSGIVNAGGTIDIHGILDSTHAILLGGTGIAVKTKAGNVASAHNYLKAFYGNNKVGGGMAGKCLAGTFFFVPLEEDKRITIDKSIVMMGDSITNLKTTRSWIEYMKGYLAFNSVTEYAHDGARWRNFSDTVYDISDYSDSSHNNTIFNQINKLKNATDNETVSIPDVVVILAGTNDVSDANNIGDIATAFSSATPVISDDVTTKLTVVESIRYCVELLRSYYPDVQIIIGSPLQRSTYPDNVRLMRDAIKECAARLSLRFINQTDESGIDYYTEVNAHKYLADGLHPNAAGAKIVGEFISLKLQSMIR